jgi:hypothetical protein
MTFSTITVDRRKLLVTALGLVSATVVTGLAISASPAVCMAPDPILAAISSNRRDVAALYTAHAKVVADPLFEPEMNFAWSAQIVSSRRLIDMAPTTLAGLNELEAFLREDAGLWARSLINRPRYMLGYTYYMADDPEAVDWHIAQCRAEIDAVAV